MAQPAAAAPLYNLAQQAAVLSLLNNPSLQAPRPNLTFPPKIDANRHGVFDLALELRTVIYDIYFEDHEWFAIHLVKGEQWGSGPNRRHRHHIHVSSKYTTHLGALNIPDTDSTKAPAHDALERSAVERKGRFTSLMLSSRKVLDEIKSHIDDIRIFRLFAAQDSNERSAYHCAFKTVQHKSMAPLLSNIRVLKLDAANVLRTESLWWTMGHDMKHLKEVHLFVNEADLEFLLCRLLSPNTYFMDPRTPVKIVIPDYLKITSTPLAGRIRSDLALQERIIIPPVEEVALVLNFGYDVDAFINLFKSIGIVMARDDEGTSPPYSMIELWRQLPPCLFS
jgi:hypothetical protein